MAKLYFVIMADGSWGTLRADNRGKAYEYLIRNVSTIEPIIIWECLDEGMPMI